MKKFLAVMLAFSMVLSCAAVALADESAEEAAVKDGAEVQEEPALQVEAEAEVHTHLVEGTQLPEDQIHSHENAKGETVTYQAWDDSTKLPTSGRYYLTVDVAVPKNTGTAQLTGDLDLCLNGHTISRADGSFWILQVRGNTQGKKADAILNIDDCTGKGGFDGKGASVGSPFIGSSQSGCAGEINCKDIFFKNAKGTANGTPGITIQNGTKSRITNCVFENLTNTSTVDKDGKASNQGYIIFGTANCTLVDCTVIGANSVFAGGGAANSTSIKVINDGVEYKAWNKDNSLPNATGSYALLGPVKAGTSRLNVGGSDSEGKDTVAGTLTLDLNGQTVTRSSGSVGMYNVNQTDVLTIIDSKGTGVVDGANIDSGSAVFMVQGSAVEGAELNLSNFTIKNIAGTASGAVWSIQGACKADIEDVTVDNCTGLSVKPMYESSSGEVVIDGLSVKNSGSLQTNGNCTIKNSTFTCSKSSNNGGAVACSAGTATIDNTEFIENDSKENGGALFVAASTTVTANECTFSKNTATKNGGAIYTKTATNTGLTLNKCTFTENGANNGGAVIGDNAGKVFYNGCAFTGNTATTRGGALYLTSGSITVGDAEGEPIVHTLFKDNKANGTGDSTQGGALYVQMTVSANYKITNAVFENNSANNAGGAIYHDTSCETESFITGCTFTGNEAIGASGGAVYQSTNAKAALNIEDCNFTSNKAHNAGAAVYVGKNVIINGGTYTGNTTGSSGVIYVGPGKSLTASDITMTGNSAVYRGGAICVDTRDSLDTETGSYNPASIVLGGKNIIKNNTCTLNGETKTNNLAGNKNSEAFITLADDFDSTSEIGVTAPSRFAVATAEQAQGFFSDGGFKILVDEGVAYLAGISSAGSLNMDVADSYTMIFDGIKIAEGDSFDITYRGKLYTAENTNVVTVSGDKIYFKELDPTKTEERITVTYHHGEVSTSVSSSIIEYFNALAKITDDAKTLSLLKAILDYGTVARKAFDYSTVESAGVSADEAITGAALDTDKPEADKGNHGTGDSFNKVTSVIPALSMKDKLYFVVAWDGESEVNYALTVGGNDPIKGVVDADGLQIATSALSPLDYGKKCELILTKGEDTIADVWYTMNSYINKMWDSDHQMGDTTLGAVVQAMAAYAQASEAFVAG